jgi:bifunctional NMN adenylyltransferase/nudix hydrolase
MNESQADFAVVIGRFQPVHLGHLELIRQAQQAAKYLIIVLGSAEQSRDTRNPWTWLERSHMLTSCLYPDLSPHEAAVQAERDGIFITHRNDIPYNEQAWVRSIQMAVQGILATRSASRSPKIILVGHKKDHTSYYLKMFPGWDFKAVEFTTEPTSGQGLPDKERGKSSNITIDATSIREAFFHHCHLVKGLRVPIDFPEGRLSSSETRMMPLPKGQRSFTHPGLHYKVAQDLSEWMYTPDCERLVEEWLMVQNYRQRTKFVGAPWDPVFVTVDAVVVQAAHILLIRRKDAPGKGLLALPGGYIKSTERIEDAMLRELKEETRLKIPGPVLKGHIKRNRVYDYPQRSQRGRLITHAYLIELEGDNDRGGQLPKVRGGDDAAHADWYPLATLRADELFEDHYHIIMDMLGING